MAIVTVNGSPNYQVGQTGSGILAGVSLSKSQTLKSIFTTSGVAADSCDLLHMKTYTFLAATPQTIDLQILVDIFGAAVAFAKVRLFASKLLGTTDGTYLLFGGAASNGWTGIVADPTDKFKVYPGTAANNGYAVFAAPNTAGMPVSGTSKDVKMDPGSAAFGMELIIAGTSA